MEKMANTKFSIYGPAWKRYSVTTTNIKKNNASNFTLTLPLHFLVNTNYLLLIVGIGKMPNSLPA